MSDSNLHKDGNDNSEEEASFSSGEYRIIPIVEPESSSEKDAVNIKQLMWAIRGQKNLIFKIVGLFLILGLLYALFTPAEYKSEAMVMPEFSEGQSQFGNLFQNFGGILGMGGSLNLSEKTTISPQVYPKIVNSRTFLQQMLNDKIYFSEAGTSLTIYQYFKSAVVPFYSGWFGDDGSEQNLGALPASLREQLSSNSISSITGRELQIIQMLRERIDLEFDTGTGVITVTALMPNALAASQVCNNAIELLIHYLEQYRTQKAQNILEFSQKKFEMARRRLRKARSKLATFRDRNVNIATAQARSQLKYLEAEFDIAYNIYNSVAQKRIQARMNLQRNTPVFNIIQPAKVPLQKNHPLWLPIIIFAIGAGLFLSFLIIAGRFIYDSYRKDTAKSE